MRLVNVTRVEPAGENRLRVTFSDARSGIVDLTDILTEGGPMVEPLRDPKMFARVFVQCGVLTWPNGFDLDAIRLYDEMSVAGLLGMSDATANAAAE